MIRTNAEKELFETIEKAKARYTDLHGSKPRQFNCEYDLKTKRFRVEFCELEGAGESCSTYIGGDAAQDIFDDFSEKSFLNDTCTECLVVNR